MSKDKGAFLDSPGAFAPLMGVLARDYITLSRKKNKEPDEGSLAPILANFEEIRKKG